MKKTILAAGLAALLASAAHAQAPQPGAQAVSPSPPAAQSTSPQFNPESVRAADVARIEAVKSSLKLTSDQEKEWPDAEAAAKRYNAARLDSVLKSRGRPPATDPLAAMEERSDSILLMGNSLRALIAGLKPLYTTLDDDQKRELMSLTGFAPSRPAAPRPPVAGMAGPAPAAAMSPIPLPQGKSAVPATTPAGK